MTCDLAARAVGWLVDGRPITNSEMDQLRQLRLAELQDRIERTGCCCDEGPYGSTGKCRHLTGMCRAVEAAQQLIWRIEHDGQ